ncbi:sigma-54-dependent Fis family transcriptional regulator [Clostridium ganghwense]|uniref:Sigma 54-interacting transcriptional regulator n=1 Tax=Clostridium ganghwense TaxID=312089 RepID=A0ABT4CJY9_9CLOT|nr:sigma 54-interacting transcriptional regulator [Clostridium ganghwense]MCY6369228.1 sigma 54-interacting transcriptional regulator [Clostridium ganghwense]
MKSILGDIQQVVMKYANIISKVLKVEVEIADVNLVRVAGTGIYKNGINRNMSGEGYVYKTVLKIGTPQIIHNPGENKLCKPCPKLHKCKEKFEMCTPIKLGNEIIGVIGLVCFSDEQKEHLMKDFDTYMEFLQQISEFISVTAYEKKEKSRKKTLLESLNLVIDKMDRGVIILNKSNRITHINKRAIEILNFVDNHFIYEIDVEEIAESVVGMHEYKLTIDNQNFHIVGNLYPMSLNENQFDRMIIFQDDKRLKDIVTGVSNTSKNICCDDILGECDRMLMLKKNLKKIALSSSTVLITGESGTGKEMFARAIHNEGNRKKEPFIAINCAAIPDALLESELFGYVKGAFTGASSSGKMGKFELANKGTIFLDEIGDMPLYLQTKILRVLQDRRIIKIGSNKLIDIDVRVIAATNKNLIKLIEENKFREDLYYRLNVIPFTIPPLRERILDTKVLVGNFVDKYTKLLDKQFSSILIDNEVWDIFYNYSWPGNIRELENTIEFMINMLGTDGRLTLDTVPNSIIHNERKIRERDKEICTLKEMEKNAIGKALEIYGASTQGKKAAAKKLGIGIATLYRKIEEYNLSK